MLYNILKPWLFSLDPEKSHHLTLETLKFLQALKIFSVKKGGVQSSLTHCFGLDFPNPVGLAAGLDKNADCLHAWQALGFGFIEVGTVTPMPQPGNPKPRLFRLTEDYALINRMGFNNKGIEYLISRIKKFPVQCPLGVNIGKNRDTPLRGALEDYLHCYRAVYPYADYVTVNLSSPNTPGLTTLQHGDTLRELIQSLKNEQNTLQQTYQKNVPLLVKISPDLNINEILTLVDTLVSLKVEGVIATNTTLRRDPYLQNNQFYQEGGLSGAPLFEPSTEMVRLIYQHVGDNLPIIAVGGIVDKVQAQAKFAAGAKLIQLYTGLIYHGPGLVKEIVQCKKEQP